MKRRSFLSLAGSLTGGSLVLPNFLHAFGQQYSNVLGNETLVFIQLQGGNDGLNTYVPYGQELYYKLRPKIGLAKEKLIGQHKGMAFHPALTGFADIQQQGDLCILQNVGYPNPNRSHFRSEEIWQTASGANEYLNDGWLGRFLDKQYPNHLPTAGINLAAVDNLALKGNIPNALTVRNPSQFKQRNEVQASSGLSGNPQLDFVRKIANSITEGALEIQEALANSKAETSYPITRLGKNLSWIARLLKGQLDSKILYTSFGGFDTHDYQLEKHKRLLSQLNEAVYAFYRDLKQANLLQKTTIVIFSEFGRRVADNGKGTDHGTAAPMFIIGGGNRGQVLGGAPDLENLDKGDLIHKIDFRSVYAALLEQKLDFNPHSIGIKERAISGIF